MHIRIKLGIFLMIIFPHFTSETKAPFSDSCVHCSFECFWCRRCCCTTNDGSKGTSMKQSGKNKSNRTHTCSPTYTYMHTRLSTFGREEHMKMLHEQERCRGGTQKRYNKCEYVVCFMLFRFFTSSSHMLSRSRSRFIHVFG